MNYYPGSLVDGLATAPPTHTDMLKLPSAYGGAAANSVMFDSYQQILGATGAPSTGMSAFNSAASHLVRICFD